MIPIENLRAELKVPNLSLFPLSPENMSPSYPEWLNNPQVNRYLLGDRSHQTLDTCVEFIQRCQQDPSVLLLGIEASLHGVSTHVGNVKFSNICAAHKTAEVGLLIGEHSLWGNGLGHRALRDAQLVARKHLRLRKITAGILATNEASRRLFSKVGFRTIGVRWGQFLVDDEPVDEVLTELAL